MGVEGHGWKEGNLVLNTYDLVSHDGFIKARGWRGRGGGGGGGG